MLLDQEIHNTPTLPTLPQGLTHLLQALNQGDIHFVRLAREIESFPNVAAKIIAVANSAWFAPISPITSLLEACSRLGLNTVRSISFALSLTDVFDPSRCSEFDAKFFWYTALLNAEAANLCAEENSKVDVQTARTAGLLYNLGLLWLAFNKPEETSRAIISAQSSESETLSESLQTELYTDHHITGGMLAQAMALPAQLVNAITCSDATISNTSSPLEINMYKAHKLAEKTMEHANSTDKKTTQVIDDANIAILLNRLKTIEAIAEALFRATR